MTRSGAVEALLAPGLPSGCYLIRKSETSEAWHVGYTLSIRYGGRVSHYLIQSVTSGTVQTSYFIDRELPHFPNLSSLVHYYSHRAHGLCCKLTCPLRGPLDTFEPLVNSAQELSNTLGAGQEQADEEDDEHYYEVPSEIVARGKVALAAYNNALSKGKTCVKRVPVMLIGQDRSGKTSLKKSLKGQVFNPDEDSTVGIDVDPTHFKVSHETWKVGEKDQESNSDAAISYEHHTAQLIVDSLTEERQRPAEERPLKPVPSGSTSLFSSTDSLTPTCSIGCHSDILEVPNTSGDTYSSTAAPGDDVSDPSKDHQEDIPSFITQQVPEEVATLVEKLLHKVIVNYDKVNKEVDEEDIYSVLWDFGGQFVYYVTHPLFLTARAIYLLIYDLSQNPHDKANPLVKQGMFKKLKDNFCLKTHLDYLDFWMTHVASLASQDQNNQSNTGLESVLPDKLPSVFLVCTHADTPYGGDPSALAHYIFDFLQTKPYSSHLFERVFVVDNTKSGSTSECPDIVCLRKEILAVAKELPQMKEAVPIKWLKYEKVLQVMKEEGHKQISLGRAEQIASEVCKIDEQMEIVTLLNFLHDQRILIHFDDTPELNKLVVLDPQWLIDVFKKVITVKPYDYKEREFKELWRQLETTGILEGKLLEHVWGPLFDHKETSESLIAIMEKFSLLCPLPSLDASFSKKYLVPSMLMTHPPEDIIELIASTNIPPAFIRFGSGQVPAGLFPRLVVKFFQWCTEEVPSQGPPQFFHNFARFYISSDEGVSVVLLCHSSSIEVIFLGGNHNLALAGSSEMNLSAEFSHDTADMTSAHVVRSQLSLMIDGMRNEFCWLKNMRCEMSFLCPVCCQQGSVKCINYCRNHHVQDCKQEECLHFFSESELYRSKEVIICTRSATAQDNRVHVKQFAPWFPFVHEKEQQATTEFHERINLPSVDGHQGKSLALPSDILGSLQSQSCNAQDVVVQLQETLQLNCSSLEEPEPDTKGWIRCLAREAKCSDRLDVVKHLGEIAPAGTTGHQDKSLALPSDILGSLQLQSCNAQDVVVQLQETLQLNRSSLEEPEADTKGWIRCLAREAKCSDRLDVVKHLRDIVPAGTTGPLLNEHLDVRNIPGQQRLDLAVHLCGGNEWKVIAERLGFNQAYIRCFDKRFPNPLEVVLSCCHSSVGELYDILVECELPVLADLL